MKTAEQIRDNLSQFCGTVVYFPYATLRGIFSLTDGVRYLADAAECYWLIDMIASVWDKRMDGGIHSYRLKKSQDDTAVFIMTDGNDNVLYTQHIPYTTFPLDEIELWASGDKVILLPSEY